MDTMNTIDTMQTKNTNDTKSILYKLRTEKGLSQDELAQKVFVTRQAVSRWENGETTPGVETLKLLSKFFDVSINTLLGAQRQLIDFCVEHMATENWPAEQVRAHMEAVVPNLEHWKK